MRWILGSELHNLGDVHGRLRVLTSYIGHKILMPASFSLNDWSVGTGPINSPDALVAGVLTAALPPQLASCFQRQLFAHTKDAS